MIELTELLIRTPSIEALIAALEQAGIYAELHEIPKGARTPPPLTYSKES